MPFVADQQHIPHRYAANHTLSAVKEIAREHAFDPVLDYLAECQGKWDGKKRIDTWVIDYMGAKTLR